VTVKGKRGTLVKSFKHLSIEMAKVGKNRLRIDIWFANRKELACLNTVVGHLKNLFKGVTYVSTGDVTLWEVELWLGIFELN
jgi:large subunit ribosomal protein L9e